MRLTTIFVAGTMLFATFSMQPACALNITALDEVSLSPKSTTGAYAQTYLRTGSTSVPMRSNAESAEDLSPTTIRIISNLLFAGLFVFALKGQNREKN